MEDVPLFRNWPMPSLNSENFDEHVFREDDQCVVVFFWGHNCPNCEVAKRSLNDEIETYKSFPMDWFQLNTYENMEMGTRFDLHGIPTFLFFRRGRILGRATSFPGHEEFKKILEKVSLMSK